jgi:hypothetical protein
MYPVRALYWASFAITQQISFFWRLIISNFVSIVLFVKNSYRILNCYETDFSKPGYFFAADNEYMQACQLTFIERVTPAFRPLHQRSLIFHPLTVRRND